jgi:hypothetical protein
VLGSWEKIYGPGEAECYIDVFEAKGFEYLSVFQGLKGLEEGQKSQFGQHCLTSS